MNKIALAAAAALTAGTFGLAAIAQSTNDFDHYDGDNDGFLTFEEALGVSSTLTQVLFDQADEDGDGLINETEFLGLRVLAPVDITAVPSSEPSSESSSESSSDSSSSSSQVM